MAKGAPFERWLCRYLSEWWTDDRRDDLLWRTAGSGARATTRGKQGKATINSYGDIMATDPAIKPLLDVMLIEAKNGYSNETIANLLDKGENNACQLYETWMKKAEEDRAAAGAFVWVIVHKRDRRDPVMFAPPRLLDRLNAMGLVLDPLAYFFGPDVDCIGFRQFFETIRPQHIKDLAKEHNTSKGKKDDTVP